MPGLQIFIVSLALTILVVLFTQRRPKGPGKLPPGPPGRDHTGLLEGFRWSTFKAWNDQYGSVATFFVGKQRSFVLGTMEAAVDILEKSSETNSNRPHLIMGQTAPNAKPMQINESAILLHDYLMNKDPPKQHKILRRYTASLMFYLGYGRRVKSLEDPLCVEHDKVEECDHPSKRRPLQWFRYKPEKHRNMNTKLYMSVMNEVKRKMEKGTAIPCTTTYGLRKQKELGFNDIELAYALSTPSAAGIGTTTTAFEIAILAMLHYPECVRKAQAEIDAVVGTDRMPNFEDQQSLPYLGGFIKETLRWRAVTPTGIAHFSSEDYTYKGMLIPKSSTIYANAAAIMIDPEVFPDGESFKPERFIETTDPRLINHRFGCFGFGRRICPGMYIALQSLYIVIARMLWAFDILPVIVNGAPFIPDANDFTNGLVSYPANLKYQLVPRSENHKELIIMEAERANADMASLDG
ncbi:cytochrome P450 [Marasmius fiardii PR-910]|nr:cytochrome P450 [Marasmius fiardii PR-910]